MGLTRIDGHCPEISQARSVLPSGEGLNPTIARQRAREASLGIPGNNKMGGAWIMAAGTTAPHHDARGLSTQVRTVRKAPAIGAFAGIHVVFLLPERYHVRVAPSILRMGPSAVSEHPRCRSGTAPSKQESGCVDNVG